MWTSFLVTGLGVAGPENLAFASWPSGSSLGSLPRSRLAPADA
jgi:hypothetical protein